MVNIKDISGSTRISIGIEEGALGKFTLMKEDYVTLPFSLDTPIYFKIGDYTDLSGVVDASLGGMFAKIYEVVDIQSPTYNTSTGGYDYNLRLDAYYIKWKNKKVKYMPESGGKEASFNLTASLAVHLGVFLENLQALGYNYRGTDFTFSIDSTVEDSAKLVTYDNTNLLDALAMYAETWGCEWWITDNIIHFGRCESGTAVNIEIAREATEMTRSDSKGTFATRIYAFGSTRNLPSNYRPTDESVVVNGVVQKRLMLPVGTPYIDAYRYDADGRRVYIGEDGYSSGTPMPEEEAIEDVVVFEDIYPKTECVVGSVGSYTDTKTDEETNETVTTTFYYVTDTSGLQFDESYILEGEELRMTFQSGPLNGMDFGATFRKAGTTVAGTTLTSDVYEIVANEDYGRLLPDDVLRPEVGNKFVLYGWDSSKIEEMGLVSSAENSLKSAAEEYAKKTMVDDGTYTVNLNPEFVYNGGEQRTFEAGQRINLVNKSFFEDSRLSRIIGFEIKLDIPYDHPVYTIGESTAYSRIGDIEGKINTLTYKGNTYQGGGGGSSTGVYVIKTNDSTAASDDNVFSAKRSLSEFLSKKRNDKTNHDLEAGSFTSKQFGTKEFLDGWLGAGGRMWVDELGKTHVEADIGLFRDSLHTMELVFNRVDVVAGELWNAPGFGTITEVDTDRQIVKLELVDGERMNVKVNDFCRGIFHHLEGSNNTSDATDQCGFPQIQGFSTSYFTPTSLLKDGSGFKYALRPGTSIHPVKGMKFAVYGNLTDKSRQSSTFSTRTRLIMLENVNTWEINPDRHYVYVRGDLEGIVYMGHHFHGHGTIQRNSYIFGSLIQLTPQQMEELKGNASYSVSLSDYEGIIHTDLDGNVVGGMSEILNVTADGSSEMNVVANDDDNVVMNVVATGYRLTARIQAFKGEKELFYSDTLQEGSFYALPICTGCTAQVTNGVLEVTSISDPQDCRVELEVNCEGNALFTKEYKVTAITDGYSPLTIDLDNEMDSIACDADGNQLFGQPETHVRCFYGTKQLTLTGLTAQFPTGVTGTADKNTGLVKVLTVAASVNDSFGVKITATANYETPDGRTLEMQGTATFTINKMKTSAIYNLLPSVSAIKVNKSGTDNAKEYEVESVSCLLRKNDGTATSTLQALPQGYTMEYSADGTAPKTYTIGTAINVTSLTIGVRFDLYYDHPSMGVIKVDTENVPVVMDGDSRSSFKSTVFLRTNSTPSKPTGGNYQYPFPTSSPTWSDGIPAGEEKLWASTRIFTSDGETPQQDAWTEPRHMTDTSDFDIAYNNSETYSGLPTSHHTADQGNGWTNTASEDTVWIATDTKKNGVWSGWQVSKIKGEKGKDATSYSISPSSLTLRKDVMGQVSPSSVTFHAYAKTGEGSFLPVSGFWEVWGSNNGIPQPGEGTELAYTSDASSFTVDKFSNSYKYYNIMFSPSSYPDSEGDPVAVSCSATVVEDGAKGDAGVAGPMYYPAGIFSYDNTYKRTDTAVPIVWHEEYYYACNSYIGTSTNPATSVSENDGDWTLFNMMDYVFAKVLFANFAKLGSAIFSGDYMLSQYGIDSAGNSTNAYEDFTSGGNDNFMPNVMIDWLTGAGHVAAGNIYWDRYGTIYRKSEEVIAWRYMNEEMGNDTTHELSLLKGSFLNIDGGTGTIYLPDPAVHQGRIIRIYNPPRTRALVYYYTLDCEYSDILQYDKDSMSYIPVTITGPSTGDGQGDIIRSELYEGAYRWIANSDMFVSKKN